MCQFVHHFCATEIERVGDLKSLPLRSLSIAVGEWIGFPVLLSVAQSLFIAAVACFFPAAAPWLLAGDLLILPLNLLRFGIDKQVFYVRWREKFVPLL